MQQCRCPDTLPLEMAPIAQWGAGETVALRPEVIVGKERPGIMQFAGIGLLNAICITGGLVGGWFADQALGTLPLFLFIGLISGIAAGVLATRSEIKRFF
jgi:hypothetical protein